MSRRPDWNCPKCNYRVFRSKDKCPECCKRRSSKRRLNDWFCSCGELNFAKREVCRLGKCKRPEKRKKWTCSCGQLNSAVRNICRRCNRMK